MSSADQIRQIASEAWEAAQRAPHGHGSEPHVEAIVGVLGRHLSQVVSSLPAETAARLVATMEHLAAAASQSEESSEEDKAKEEAARAAQAERIRVTQTRQVRSVQACERTAAALERVAQLLAERVPPP